MIPIEPAMADILRFRIARLLAQRDAYRSQRDDLANAIGAHHLHHPSDEHESDTELWNAYAHVMGQELDASDAGSARAA